MMTNARFIQSRSTVLLGLILSVVMTCGVTFGDILNDEDSLTPAAFADSDDSVFAATTSDPILLHRGTVLETSTDLSFDTPIGTWEHTRTYQSGLRLQQNVNDKRDVQGQQWLSGTGSRVLTKIGDNIRLTRTASNSRVFMFDNDKYVPPAGLDASLVKRGADATEEFVLTFNDSGSVYIYYGFHSSVAEALRGKLKEKSNLNYQAAKLAGERYTYDDGGVLVSVTTAEPQSYYIKYSYSKTEQNINRLTRIEVFAGDNTALKFAQSEYTYYEFLPLPNEDVGSFGDLIQVKTSILLSDRKNWNTKTIQYRYYRSEKDGGFNHQVKYVLEADAVERILSSNVGLKNSENILTKSDADKLQSGHTIKDYASRSFTYNKETIDTNKEIATVWGNENLVQKYGNSEVNRVTPVGRVKTETVNSNCVSCGGGANGGVTKTYYYINVSEIPQRRSRGIDNVVVHVIIEDLQDADGVPQKRTIYGLHNRGNELRKIEIENPTAAKLNVVATSTIENSASQPVEVRSPDVHTLIDSNELVAKFLNPYNEKTKKSENDIATRHGDKGVISVYEYDNSRPPRQTGELKKVGANGNAFYVKAMDYDKNGDVIAIYDYPTASAIRDAKDRVTIKYNYTYWYNAKRVIQTKTTTKSAVPTAQNGSSREAVSKEYFDANGNLRWTIDAVGVVNYYGYHSVSGKQTLVVRDVDTAALPTIITNGSTNVVAWKDKLPFSRSNSLAKALSQTTYQEYDEQGRLVKTIGNDNVSEFIIYDNNRRIQISAWDVNAKQPTLPIQVIETNDAGNVTSIYSVSPTNVLVEGDRPIGISSNKQKISWTRYHYDPLHGGLEYVDKYHTLATDEGKLGDNYYRTTYIRDQLGREVATAKFVDNDKWQVEGNRFDWRGRKIEMFQGVTTKAPDFDDVKKSEQFVTLSKTIYDGNRISDSISYFDKGDNDYVGTKYKYDEWNRVRATVSYAVKDNAVRTLAPFTVNDLDWRGNVVFTASFGSEPDWSNVVKNKNYASTTEGKVSASRNHYNIFGYVWKTEVLNNVSNKFDVTTFKYDNVGREISTTHDNTTVETLYDSLGRDYERRTLSGTVLMSIQMMGFDAAENVISQESIQLNPNETTSIDLNGTNFTRRTIYSWYDVAGRKTVQADYGSGATTWKNAAKPARPEVAPETSNENCLVTKYGYSQANEDVEVITSTNGIVTRNVYDALNRVTKTITNPVAGGTASDENVEIQYYYDGLNNTLTLTAINQTTGNQVTEYLYEDKYNAALQTSAIYPDSSDTSSKGTDQVKTSYYIDGKIKTVTDQNGTIRAFSYDSYRRPVADVVTTLGNGVDGNVRKLSRSYTNNGELETVTTINSQNKVLNEVRYEYDKNRKLKKLYQSFSNAVDTKTQCITYDYDTASGNRLSSVIYPSGKTLTYTYNNFDNISSISENKTPLVSYVYDGSGSPMQTTYNQPNVSLTYANGGLDRYGRVINHQWNKGNEALVHIVHDYDYAGNRTKRYDVVRNANSELYQYDKLNQIKNLKRGELNKEQTEVSVATHTESWNFDKTGNWQQYTRNENVENRTHNAANELQDIATHDANGNMILMPGLKCKYDAWNRIVEVRNANNELIATYEYNGLNRRIKKTVGKNTTKSFFNENWQELESQTNSDVTSYVWGLRYIDDLVLREKDKERLYSIADPNWNVVAIIDSTGDVKERYTYGAFGKRNVFDVNFTAKTGTSFDWTGAFTGQVLDVETGLMLYRNRFYNVDLGRFVSRDPIEYSDDINLFRYVNNSPVVGNDATGLFNQYDGQIRGCMQQSSPAREECLNNLLSLYSEFPNDPTMQSAIKKVEAAIKKTKSERKQKKSGVCFCFSSDTPDFSTEFFRNGSCQSQAECFNKCKKQCKSYKSALCSFN